MPQAAGDPDGSSCPGRGIAAPSTASTHRTWVLSLLHLAPRVEGQIKRLQRAVQSQPLLGNGGSVGGCSDIWLRSESYLRQLPPALGPPHKDTVAAHCAPDGAPPVLASHCVVCKRFLADLVEHERGGGGERGRGLGAGVTGGGHGPHGTGPNRHKTISDSGLTGVTGFVAGTKVGSSRSSHRTFVCMRQN